MEGVLSLFDSFFSFLEEGEDFIKITVDVIVVDASLQINKINVFLFLRRVSELAFEKFHKMNLFMMQQERIFF